MMVYSILIAVILYKSTYVKRQFLSAFMLHKNCLLIRYFYVHGFCRERAR